MGHECKEVTKKEPDKVEKRWKPKPVQRENVKKLDEQETTNEPTREWIEVKSSIKNEGVETGIGSSTVDSQNGFAILGGV